MGGAEDASRSLLGVSDSLSRDSRRFGGELDAFVGRVRAL
jgi:hypothetical protein